jgi:hypothetical protein
MLDNHLLTLAKLDSTNYMVWITHMEDHLVGKDLLEAVTPGLLLSGTPSVEDLQKDCKAFALLRTYVSDSLIHFLTSSMSAADAWLILADMNLSNSYSKIRGLIKAVVRLHLLRAKCNYKYIQRAMAMQLSLHMANEPISEMLMVTAILGGLPREFSTIVTILEAEDATLTISSTEAKLCVMEQYIRDDRTPAPEAKAMFSGKPLYCEYCKRSGHSEERCYSKDPANKIKYPANAKPEAVTVMTVII